MTYVQFCFVFGLCLLMFVLFGAVFRALWLGCVTGWFEDWLVCNLLEVMLGLLRVTVQCGDMYIFFLVVWFWVVEIFREE